VDKSATSSNGKYKIPVLYSSLEKKTCKMEEGFPFGWGKGVEAQLFRFQDIILLSCIDDTFQ
jgi:hypothetical protein